MFYSIRLAFPSPSHVNNEDSLSAQSKQGMDIVMYILS